jgi:T5SS/PEP-CTERM-associated repeat protein
LRSVTLTIADALTVGEAGTGTFSVSDGGTVTADSLDVAVEETSGSPSDGTPSDVNIDGDGSMLTIKGNGSIGDGGYGTMELTGGATASFENLDIAVQASSGSTDDDLPSEMMLDGAETALMVSDTLTVGDGGFGYMDVSDGATVTVDSLIVAAQETSGAIGADHETGDVTGEPSGIYLHDSGTSLSVDEDVTVGDGGFGFIDVFDGSSMSASSIDIAAEATSGDPGSHDESYVEVNNADSTLTVGGNVTVGDAGYGGFTVFDGASATVGGDLDIGKQATSGTADTQSFVAVQDEGSSLDISGTTTVGDAGNGSLYIGDGGTFTTGGDDIDVGKEAGSTGLLEIDSSTATLDFEGTLTIGDAGTGTFDLEDGATWTTDGDITLGLEDGSTGTLDVDGEGSSFDPPDMTVGSSGTGIVTVSTGGSLEVGNLTLGEEATGDGTVTVADADSSLTVDGDLEVGSAGQGLLLIDGDSTVSGETTVGSESGGTGQITVNIATLELDGDTTIGKAGAGSVLVQQGGTITAHEVTLGDELGSSGTLTVDGDGTTMTTGALTVGSSGAGTLHVTDGAQLTSSDDSTLGDLVSANVAAATIGTQGLWSVIGGLTVGGSGIAVMTIEGGGNVASTDDVTLGDQNGASGEVDIDGVSADGSTPSGLGFGGTLTIGNGGTGTLKISDGALVAPTSGGKGAIEIAAQQESSGTVSVDGNGSELEGATLAIGGTDTAAGGTASLTISNQGLVDVNDITLWNGGSVSLAGGLIVTDTLTEQGGAVSGFGSVDGAITDDGTITAAGGTLGLSGDVSGTGSLVIDTGGRLDVEGVSNGIGVTFEASASNETLGIDDHSAFLTTISGFGTGDTIDLADIGYSSGDTATLLADNILQIAYSGGDYDLQLDPSDDYSGDIFRLAQDGSGNGTDVTENVACYCRGTMILTENGEVPVEDLSIGDWLMTASGVHRSIKWIGKRGYGGRFIIGKRDVLPICFKAGSLGDNLPKRDLWISPHHAMYLEGRLIEAKDLVNGVSIIHAAQVKHVEYFHVELESHDVIVAEGALSETFIDDDSRGMFHNAHEYFALYPGNVAHLPNYYAPRLDSGYEIEVVRRRLAERAGIRLDRGQGIGALRGHVDLARPDRIIGWAQNIDHPEAPVCLDICVGGRLIGQTLANVHREDLQRAGIGSGNHSFEFRPLRGWDVLSCAIEVRRSLDGVVLEGVYCARA